MKHYLGSSEWQHAAENVRILSEALTALEGLQFVNPNEFTLTKMINDGQTLLEKFQREQAELET
jgi:hypothetical protein